MNAAIPERKPATEEIAGYSLRRWGRTDRDSEPLALVIDLPREDNNLWLPFPCSKWRADP